MSRSCLSRATIVTIASAVVVSCLSLGIANAQTAGVTASSSASSPASSPVFGFVQGLVGLVIVIGAIFAAGWLLKKVGPRTRAGGIVQVVGGASVGPREKVVVVRFGGQTLLLGVAPGQVSLLQATGTVDGVDAIDGTSQASATPRFIDRLRAARSGG